MYCVLADRLDCAEILLKAGASVNKTDHSQRTALHLAAQKVRTPHTQEHTQMLTIRCVAALFLVMKGMIEYVQNNVDQINPQECIKGWTEKRGMDLVEIWW